MRIVKCVNRKFKKPARINIQLWMLRLSFVAIPMFAAIAGSLGI